MAKQQSSDVGQSAIAGMGKFTGLPAIPVTWDLGAVNDGVSNARRVRCENGQEYLIKSATLNAANPYVAANEFVAARLAETLHLPILDNRIVFWRNTLHFGSAWIDPNTFDKLALPNKLRECQNIDRIYDMAVFDVWLCNVDRHRGNIITRILPRPDGSVERSLIFNDHSHCLFAPACPPGPPTTAKDLASLATSGLTSSVLPHRSYFAARILEHMIEDSAKLRDALDNVVSIPNHVIKYIVASLPPEFIPAADRAAMENFLLNRRKNLKQIFRNERATFVNLGGPL